MPSVVVPEAVRSLSVAMREDSRSEHEAAEHSSFMSELLSGRVNEQGYVDYLLRLRAVYRTLEETVRARQTDPVVGAFYDPMLERSATIDADLDHWAPDSARAADSPAAQAYCTRITETTWGGALVAHHYTRYLGDLSGGQAIGRVLDRAFDLQGAGLSFYEFPVRPKPYKDTYRARLDGLDLDQSDIDRVVDEVKVAFALNQAVFDELTANLPAYRR
ncbi:heme oxygenase (biliverdin-producing) [Mycolicibacterium fortuitum]|uniref:biliverdin-producing heme oxygenase n=1 Tax=Mycolicibacterium fortuitum TaxID=1766 RepID=UPI0007EB68EB|nr:biliverdin-producing heme oxygenase [Mycolicibacterium fortuitum]OBG50460.1 heme oxygenase [Mycolicibacterium fortuitum]OBI70316.1 heme oxygenase [Mycolicibacterium fortuitum]